MTRHWIAGGALAAALALAVPAAAQQPFNLTAAGLGATGVMATINTAVNAAVQAAWPGSTITYQTAAGGFANIAAIDQGRVPLGYAVDAEMAAALAGREPFRARVDSFRTIAHVAGFVPMHFIVTKEFADRHGLKDFRDIAAKKPPIKVIFNTRGNVVSSVSEALFREIGVSLADIRAWGGEVLYVPGQEHGAMFADRRADAMVNQTNIGAASMVDIMRSREVVMLSVDRAIIDKVAADVGMTTMTIPKAAYPFMTEDLYTLTLGIALLAHRSVSDDHAYRITKALVEQNAAYQATHRSLQGITPEYMASLKIGEYHPGAARLYREKGLMR